MQTVPRGLRLVFLSLALFISGTCFSGAEIEGKESAKEANETRIYQVFGMDCPGCHGGLEKLVKKIPQVKDAKANFKEQQLVVMVDSDKSLSDEVVHDAIQRANFTPGKRLK